ncbi:tetratricopeptide repeat protein [Saccharothrix violaceirubra]|uniref:Tetratricopeptide (TPR) repeat protein n=1 Tax=Saccharothrix violaceirubra TaxID=413306 RepID=A0A7W7WXS2_9PSEU|nr:NB-ARC domain-containing protein [Saccharothrix violaceirubra]MBB4966948.1 tetratricopeptide (TPR) repeat protein [Saccharothrix violaceirubra]
MDQPGNDGARRNDATHNDVDNDVDGTVGAVVQAGPVQGGIVVNNYGRVPVGPPDELPPPPSGFVNRVRELAALDGAAGVAVVTGLAGVGKSALVHEWADRQAGRFPDGKLYVDFAALRTPGGTAVADGLAGCLRSLGVDHRQLPTTLAALVALYRTKTAGGRRLVVLDDVSEAAHVSPFLTRASGSVVVATSNERLVELTLDGAATLELGPLTPDDSVLLLRALCTDGRIDADPVAARALARRCAGLPVALRVAAGRLLSRRFLTVAGLADELADDARGLDALAYGGEHRLSTVFDNSYRDLDPAAAALYRRLGLLPVRDFPLDVIRLADPTGDSLERLVRANLLDEVDQDRYAFHRLVALHARERARDEDGADVWLRRVLEYYLDVVRQADWVVMGNRLRITPGKPGESRFVDRAQALDRLAAERANLLALLREAATHGYDDVAWQLAEGLTALYFNRRHLEDWVESADLGAAAARRVDNPAAEARLRSVVSRAYTELDHPDRAGEELRVARELAERSGHAVLIASVWEFTGRHLDRVDPAAAVEAYRTALARNLEAGERRGAALAKYFLGAALHAAGRPDEALLVEAYDELASDERMAARVSVTLGALRADAGRLDEARADLEAAVRVLNGAGLTHYEAQALPVLADVLERLGLVDEARERLRRLIVIREDAGLPVDDLKARLGQ